MSRIFVDQPLAEHTHITLTGELHHYLRDVLRMKEGDPLFLFNGSPKEYAAKINTMNKKNVEIDIFEGKEVNKESPLKITIAQAIPKGQKFDDMLPRLTELGVSHIVPIITDRCDVKKTSDNKLKRWKKIVTASAQQTGRTQVPLVSSPVTLPELFLDHKHDLTILFYELEESQTFNSLLDTHKGQKGTTICFVIGPEGGFTPAEISLALKSGCKVASLGKRILRTETVAPAVTAIAQYVLGDLNDL